MKQNLIVILLSILTCWGMGTWAFVFYWVAQKGEVIVYEPAPQIIYLELAIACLCAAIAIGTGIFAIVKLSKSIKERME